MEIHLGADHRGYELKQQVADYLRSLGHEIVDHGTMSGERTDYPRFGRAVAEAVVGRAGTRAGQVGRAGAHAGRDTATLQGPPAGEGAGPTERLGVVICGSGVGIAMAANKVRGARCAAGWCEHIAEYTRRHNHANILAFSADMQTIAAVRRCLDAYLAATPEGGRHAERVAMLEC